MLTEMSNQAQLEQISLVKTWRTADIQGKLGLQRTMLPDGLVWNHEVGFLNHKNEIFMDGLRQLFQKLWRSSTSSRRIDCQGWRPRRDLNPCYRRERAMS